MTTALGSDAGYRAAGTTVGFLHDDTIGVIRLAGRDRLSLLHRLSTNQLEQLPAGSGTLTVLTTPIGRMLDLLRVAVLEDEVILVTGPQKADQITRHLKRNIFFNDRLTVQNVSETLSVFALIGPAVEGLLEQFGFATAAQPFAVQRLERAAGALVLQRAGRAAAATLVLVPSNAAEAFAAELQAAGAAAVAPDVWQTLRIERGEGAVPTEISEEYIPLESGLWSAVSFSKGCYVGQEIIARMESRGRLAKQLRKVHLTQLPAELPQTLRVDGKDAGMLTSAAVSPREGLIGLAYVRTAFLTAQRPLQFLEGEARLDTDGIEPVAAESDAT